MTESLPAGWTRTNLGAVAAVKLGKTPPRSAYSDHGAIKLIKFRDLKRGHVDWSNTTRGFTEPARGLKELRAGDTLITASAHSPEHIGKKLAFVDRIPDRFDAVCYVGELLGIRVSSADRLAPRWPLYYFQSPDGQAQIAGAVRGGHLTNGRAQAMSITLPPLGEQRAITAILSAVDATIEATQAVIAQLGVVKQAVVQALLTRGLPGRHARFAPAAFGDMPSSWEACTLAALTVPGGLQTGPFGSQLKASEYTATGVPVIMPQDLADLRVSTTHIARIPAPRAASLGVHRVEPGDIVFGRRGEIGRCALITDAERGWICGTGCLRVRPRQDAIIPAFLLYQLDTAPVRAWLVERAVGQTMLNLNTKILADIPVSVPPVPEQRDIVAAAQSVDARVAAERASLARCVGLKRALMSALLTGKVRVTAGDA